MMGEAHQAAGRLQHLAATGGLDEVCEAFGVRLLSLFGSAASHDDEVAAHANDLDIGLLLDHAPDWDSLGIAARLGDLIGFDEIDLVFLNDADAIVRVEALWGVALYESAEDLFAEERIRATRERFEQMRFLEARMDASVS